MNERSVALFWEKFIDRTKHYGVKKDIQRWYVKHAEDYIRFYEGKKLIEHSIENVEYYLKLKGRSDRILDWQFQQTVTAIEILFVDMVTVSWASRFHWNEWSEFSKTLSHSHPTVARDYQAPACDFKDKNLAFGDDNVSAYKIVLANYPEHISNT